MVGGCGATLPQPNFERFDIRVTPTPSAYPDVPGVVLLDRGTLHLTVDPERRIPLGRFRRYRRIKILRPSGTDLATITVPYHQGEALHGLRVRGIAPDGNIHETNEGEAVDIPMGHGQRARMVKVDGAQPGWVIECTYDRYMEDLRFLEPWVFQSHIPTVRSEYAVITPPTFQVDVRFSQNGRFVNRPPERFETPEGVRFFWSVSDIPARFPEPNMPSLKLLAPRAHVIFLEGKIGAQRFEGLGSWDQVAAWFLDRVSGWDRVSSATAEEARRVAGDASNEEKALKLQEVIARDLGWEEERDAPVWRARLPHPDDVLAEKKGNRSSRGLLLTALLRSAGLDAIPALAAGRAEDTIAPDAPTVTGLTSVVAVIPKKSGLLILDPSDPTVSGDVPPPSLQGTRLILLRPEGAEVRNVPLSSADQSRTEVLFTVEIDQRGELFGKVEARFTGAEAGALRAKLMSASPEDFASILNGFLRSRGAGLSVESIRVADLKALRRPLVLQGTVSIPGSLPGEGEEPLLRLGALVGGPESALREVRRTPLDLGVPRTVEIRVRLTLPADYQVGPLPGAVSEAWSGGEFEVSVRSETQRRLGIHRRETQTILSVTPDGYPEYKRFREGVRVAEDQVLSIRRPPPRKPGY